MTLVPELARSTRSVALGSAAARVTALLALAVTCVTLSGCLLASNLMHAVGADMIPAEYDGLADHTVAVIVVTDGSQYSNDVAARDLTRRVSETLTTKVKEIQLVREDLVQQWRDTHGWDEIDFAAIGKGVDAEQVVGIEVTNMNLRDGATLYRGRADVMVKVIDVETGNVVFTKSLDEYTYPKIAGQYTNETTETRFRKLYLGMLATEIGRSFHPYDMSDRIAIDSKIASQ